MTEGRGVVATVVHVLLWLLVVAAAGVSTWIGFNGLSLASSSPQEAAVAAIALFVVAVPYFAARAFDVLSQAPAPTRRCVACDESIRLAARKCRFCGTPQDVPAESMANAITSRPVSKLSVGLSLLGGVLFLFPYVLRQSGQFIMSGSGLATTLTSAMPVVAMITMALFGFALVRRALGHSPSFVPALVALGCVSLLASWASLIA